MRSSTVKRIFDNCDTYLGFVDTGTFRNRHGIHLRTPKSEDLDYFEGLLAAKIEAYGSSKDYLEYVSIRELAENIQNSKARIFKRKYFFTGKLRKSDVKEFIKIEEIQKLKFSYSWINRFLCDKYSQNELNNERDRSRPRRQNLPFTSSNYSNDETKESNTAKDGEMNEFGPKSVIVREFEDKLVAEIDKCGSASTFHSLRTMAERVQNKFLGLLLRSKFYRYFRQLQSSFFFRSRGNSKTEIFLSMDQAVFTRS